MKFTLICGKSASVYLGIIHLFHCSTSMTLHTAPVCFPDVNGIFILDVMFFSLLIKKVKEVLHSWWHNMVWVKHTMKEVIYKLLKCPLKAKFKKSVTFVLQAELSYLPPLMAFILSAKSEKKQDTS